MCPTWLSLYTGQKIHRFRTGRRHIPMLFKPDKNVYPHLVGFVNVGQTITPVIVAHLCFQAKNIDNREKGGEEKGIEEREREERGREERKREGRKREGEKE